jgi:serine/threonine protein kinase
VAVKVIKRDRINARAEELLRREVKHHERLRHPNIVRLYTWIKSPAKYYLVMECCGEGDLLKHLNQAGMLQDAAAYATQGSNPGLADPRQVCGALIWASPWPGAASSTA